MITAMITVSYHIGRELQSERQRERHCGESEERDRRYRGKETERKRQGKESDDQRFGEGKNRGEKGQK
jgi:hypothetical protein